MNAFAPIALFALGFVSLAGAQVRDQALELEKKGDALAARNLLQRAVRESPQTADTVLAYAEFLDRYGDPEARETYEKALPLVTGDRHVAAARRLMMLSLIEGDAAAAAKYAAVAGVKWKAPDPPPAADRQPGIFIPGPLASFSRMAALSPEQKADEVLTALARNVITNGYQASATGEALEATEYMKLLTRYVSQARELEKMAGDGRKITIPACESQETGDLLRILGYRMRGGCGSEVVLETVNATRAFLTIDSGFPIAELEQALRTNRPFTHEYKPARVPVLYGAEYWLTSKERQGEFIDAFLADPGLCRFYLGMAKLDPDTAAALRKSVPAQRLRAFAHVLDFFGGMFEIRGGKAIVPGGARAASAWADLAGASPDQGAAFLEKLISRDDGWLASYFDALSRVNGPLRDYLTEPQRMKRFYAALRGRITSPGPARPVFRSNTDLMLLTTRLWLERDGRPHIPGNIDVWKNLFIRHPHGKYDGKLTRAASGWSDPDDVVEALFALCRKAVENEPLKIFLALSDIDRARAKPLNPTTVDRLAREYRTLGAQYTIFNEVPALRDETVLAYVDAARAITRIGDSLTRANAAGLLQALAGLWQIFTRQRAIPQAEADAALAAIIAPFQTARRSRELFDAGRAGVKILLKAAESPADAKPQERMMDLLAGAAGAADTEAHSLVVQEMVRVFEAQRLVSLDVLFELADNLESVSRGEKLNTALAARLASRITEIQLPRTGLTAVERNAFALGYWTERHIDAQRRMNLRRDIERAGGKAEDLADVRGQLGPLLRDTLVGLNYAHYAPPGAQLLYANPIFVRSHDFIGLQGTNQTWKTTEVLGGGWPSSGGGRLIGSLSGLPYALAEAEQNFMIPTREQALIWGDLVPQLVVAAKVPRWWRVKPAQMHWVDLHMRLAESLLAEAVPDAQRRETLLAALEEQLPPARIRQVARLLESADVRAAIESITPAEMFLLARRMCESGSAGDDPLARQIVALQKESPGTISYAAISDAFGTPKPTLTTSYRPALLYLRMFPTLMGYSSRIMAESWESTVLYWAALADQVHLPPSQLNLFIPEWTQKTVEKIFATHLEDWPAVLRSMRTVGEDERMRLRIQLGDARASGEE